MRRLIIRYLVGVRMVPVGLELFLNRDGRHIFSLGIIEQAIGLMLTVVGPTLPCGGLVGAAFKLVTDANRLADET